MLYGDLHVQQALALVSASEAYSEVLLVEDVPRVEGQVEDDDNDEPQVVQAAVPSPVLRSSVIRPKEQHVGGRFHLIFLSRPHTARMPPHHYV